jgi:hypothetical protein
VIEEVAQQRGTKIRINVRRCVRARLLETLPDDAVAGLMHRGPKN